MNVYRTTTAIILYHVCNCTILHDNWFMVIVFACYGSGYQAVSRTMLPSLDRVFWTRVTQLTQFTYTHTHTHTKLIVVTLHK